MSGGSGPGSTLRISDGLLGKWRRGRRPLIGPLSVAATTLASLGISLECVASGAAAPEATKDR
jgi:hypothetical protein